MANTDFLEVLLEFFKCWINYKFFFILLTLCSIAGNMNCFGDRMVADLVIAVRGISDVLNGFLVDSTFVVCAHFLHTFKRESASSLIIK